MDGNKTIQKEKTQPKPTTTLKLILGSLSLITVFFTPYLNITQFTLSMNLFQSAIYSLILLSFWVFAAKLLHLSHPISKTTSSPKHNKTKYSHQYPIAS